MHGNQVMREIFGDGTDRQAVCTQILIVGSGKTKGLCIEVTCAWLRLDGSPWINNSPKTEHKLQEGRFPLHLTHTHTSNKTS
jgi:hypothetical protein